MTYIRTKEHRELMSRALKKPTPFMGGSISHKFEEKKKWMINISYQKKAEIV